MAMAGDRLSLYPPPVSLVASSIDSRIAVQKFSVPTRHRHPDPVAMSGNRRQVADAEDAIGLIP